MLIQNQRGNVFVLSLVVTVGIVTGGSILMMAFSKKTDFISRYERKADGMGRLEEEIKFIQPFTYDWLESQRTSAISKTIVNQCIPKQTDYVAQDFTKCPQGTPLSASINSSLWAAYKSAKNNTLSTITASSRVVTLPLVDIGDRPIAGTQSNPALFDESGLPCITNTCQYSVAGYMLKENASNNPGSVVFAFNIKDLGNYAGSVRKKDQWIFIPVLSASWNRMPLNSAWAKAQCPSGSFAVGFLPNRKVICRDHEMECLDGQYLQSLDENGNPICKQIPIFVEPVPAITRIACSSWGWAYAQCPYTLPDPNSSLGNMSVNYQMSKTTCIAQKNYWYSETPAFVWTNIGCRASFNLEFYCNTDYYYDYAAKVCRLVSIGEYSPDKNNGRYTCTNNPSNSQFTGRGGGANACPWACDAGYYRSGVSTCIGVSSGYYSPALDNSQYPCTTAPANAHYTGSGFDTNSCPWACNSGYDRVGGSCVPTPTPTPTPSPTP